MDAEVEDLGCDNAGNKYTYEGAIGIPATIGYTIIQDVISKICHKCYLEQFEEWKKKNKNWSKKYFHGKTLTEQGFILQYPSEVYELLEIAKEGNVTEEFAKGIKMMMFKRGLLY